MIELPRVGGTMREGAMQRVEAAASLDWSGIVMAFGEKIKRRLNATVPTSEDMIRYYFFLELLAAGIQPAAIALERPHPHRSLKDKEIDLSIYTDGGIWDFEMWRRFGKVND
jgi:hypothetical protein